MDDELVLRRIDIRYTAMTDREVQAVRCDDALQVMMWRARSRIARQIVGIVDRAHHRLLEARGYLIGSHRRADLETPGSVRQRRVGERFRRCARGKRRRDAQSACNRSSLSQQRSPIDQTIPGNRRRTSVKLSHETAHDVAPCSRFIRPGFARTKAGLEANDSDFRRPREARPG